MQRAARLSLVAMMALLSTGPGRSAGTSEPARYSTDRVEHARREFGDVRFIMGSGQAMNWLEMHVAGNLVAAYRDFDAQEVHASPDGNFFLAISNKAYSSFAYAVLDRGGRLVFSSPHVARGLSYCVRGAGNDWHWIDTDSPEARFELERISWASPARNYLKSVTVRDCKGKDVLLGKAAEPRQAVPPNCGARRAVPADTGVRREPAADAEAEVTGSRSSYFIGNTIANLRGLDPYGECTRVLIDGRRVVPTLPQPKAEEPNPVRPATTE